MTRYSYPTHPTYDDLEAGCIEFTDRLQDMPPHAVLGLARGGLFNALIFSHQLGDIPLIPIDYSSTQGAGDNIDSHANTIPQIKYHRLLLVDDIADSGHTMSEVAHILTQRGHEVFTYVSFWKELSAIEPDGFQFKIPEDGPWIVFPWE